MKSLRIQYHDKGPDSLGRRRFTLFWEDPDGIFRPEAHPDDGQPVGYRRAQCFHADPGRFEAKLVNMKNYTESTTRYRYAYLANLPQEDAAPDHPLYASNPGAFLTVVTEGDEDVPTGAVIAYDDNGPWARVFLPSTGLS